jgi:hypothetical protein
MNGAFIALKNRGDTIFECGGKVRASVVTVARNLSKIVSDRGLSCPIPFHDFWAVLPMKKAVS